jgi:hypothetical protein
MSSRFLIPVLCLGAVAFACGPRAHNEASMPKNTESVVAVSKSASVAQQGMPRAKTKSKKPSLAAELYVRTHESNIQFALHVRNTSTKRVELTFPSGQTYDFVVLDSTGREMWRWGTSRMFTQTLQNKLLGAGESLELKETMKSSPLPPGRYVARAMLTSANYPLVQEAKFTVTATTIASR